MIYVTLLAKVCSAFNVTSWLTSWNIWSAACNDLGVRLRRDRCARIISDEFFPRTTLTLDCSREPCWIGAEAFAAAPGRSQDGVAGCGRCGRNKVLAGAI